jgi:AcrR family transcriptional regulator
MAKVNATTRKKKAGLNRRAIPQQERSRERVAAILAASSRLLTKYGFDALNTRQIAAAAKLPPGLIYHYFPNKTAIVMQLAEQSVQPLRYELTQLLGKAKAGSWREAIRQFVSKLTAVYRGEPAAAAILQALQSDPDLRRFNRRMNERFALMIARFLRAGGAQSDSRSLLRSARLVVLSCDAVAPDLVAVSRAEAENLSVEVSELLVSYLGKYLREPSALR